MKPQKLVEPRQTHEIYSNISKKMEALEDKVFINDTSDQGAQQQVSEILQTVLEVRTINPNDLFNDDGLSLLHLVTRFGNVAEVSKMLKIGANVNAVMTREIQSNEGKNKKRTVQQSALCFAIQIEDLEKITEIFSREDLDFDTVKLGIATAIRLNKSDLMIELFANKRVIENLEQEKDPQKTINFWCEEVEQLQSQKDAQEIIRLMKIVLPKQYSEMIKNSESSCTQILFGIDDKIRASEIMESLQEEFLAEAALPKKKGVATQTLPNPTGSQVQALKQIIQAIDEGEWSLDFVSSQGFAPLQFGARYGTNLDVEKLLKMEANPNFKEGVKSPLQIAAMRKNHAIAQTILKDHRLEVAQIVAAVPEAIAANADQVLQNIFANQKMMKHFGSMSGKEREQTLTDWRQQAGKNDKVIREINGFSKAIITCKRAEEPKKRNADVDEQKPKTTFSILSEAVASQLNLKATDGKKL